MGASADSVLCSDDIDDMRCLLLGAAFVCPSERCLLRIAIAQMPLLRLSVEF